jgi:D-alanine transaminase
MVSVSNPAWAWCDGRLTPFSEAKVPIEDRGLQFGESLYEVVAVMGGEPFRLLDHVERMRKGAAELGLESGVPYLAGWTTFLAQLHRREPHPSALLYAQVTGGAAPRRHVPAEARRPFFFAYLRPFTFPAPAEISRGIAASTLPDPRWQRRDLKTTMLLPAVIARRLAGSQGADEVIFIGTTFVDEDQPFLFKHPRNTTPFTKASIVFGEDVSHIGNRTVFIIC